MILSHRNRFIFVKNGKVAGTSIQMALDPLCGDDDVITPIDDTERPVRARNYQGWFNPAPELWTAWRAGIALQGFGTRRNLRARKRFTSHMPGWLIRQRAPEPWRDYLTFCVERNPWDKVASAWWYIRWHAPDLDVDTYLDHVEEHISLGHAGRGTVPYNLPNYTDPRTGDVIVDRVLQYDMLAQDLAGLLRELGREVPELPRAYSGRRPSDSSAGTTLNRRQVGRVGELFRPEIELHGYRPPG